MADEFVVGLEQFLKDLGDLPLTMQRTLIVRSLREASEPVAERIRELAPDDPMTAGSRIKDNIGVNVVGATADHGAALIGPTKFGFIARFHEHGTADMTGKPFMGPAFNETVEAATNIIGKVLGDGIEKELKR